MYLEVGRGSPDAVASGADNGALVDVTGADEAVVKILSAFTRYSRRREDHDDCFSLWLGDIGKLYLESMYAISC
jgi:hypothetical protein